MPKSMNRLKYQRNIWVFENLDFNNFDLKSDDNALLAGWIQKIRVRKLDSVTDPIGHYTVKFLYSNFLYPCAKRTYSNL